MRLSVISPVYQAGNIVEELVRRICEEASKITGDFEIILVDDGSLDNSWNSIADICSRDSRVKGIKLSRNFGQHYAITAGISKATGENLVLMDCDLQDDPVFLNDLIKQRSMGFDIVFTKRIGRKHGVFKTFSSWIYNKLFVIFADKKFDVNAGSLILFSRQVADIFLQFKDKDRLYLQIFKWVGFKTTTIEVQHNYRHEGKSTYSFMKLIRLGLQGWTSHSTRLLRISIYFGFILASFSFLAALMVLARYFMFDLQPGWPSIIISILGSTGMILISIGIAGLYIGKIFEQVKDRPIYLIEKEININES